MSVLVCGANLRFWKELFHGWRRHPHLTFWLFWQQISTFLLYSYLGVKKSTMVCRNQLDRWLNIFSLFKIKLLFGFVVDTQRRNGILRKLICLIFAQDFIQLHLLGKFQIWWNSCRKMTWHRRLSLESIQFSFKLCRGFGAYKIIIHFLFYCFNSLIKDTP